MSPLPSTLDRLRAALEPATAHINEPGDAALLSIAVSLKRIADALTPQDGAATSQLVQEISEMQDYQRVKAFVG